MKSLKLLAPLVILLIATLTAQAQLTVELPQVKFIDYQPENRQWFVRFGQFQIHFDYEMNPTNGLALVKNPAKHIAKIEKCLELAKKHKLNVLVFPEISMSLPDKLLHQLLATFQHYSKENDAIIIAGTFYDDNHYCKNATILPSGIHYSYKIRPSIFEVSPLRGEGMAMSDTLHVFRTKYGNLLTLVCVDLISDDANYIARTLSNRGLIDMLVNINYNPKSQEFMREASAMTVRHPLFVSLTNVTLFRDGCTVDGDEYGNTSLFGSINNNYLRKKLLHSIPAYYKTPDNKELQPAYKYLLGIVNPKIEGMLMYDLNLRMIRPPLENNAPDQGYPTVKNMEIIGLDSSEKSQCKPN